jgi:hypothetical protein
MEGIWVCKCGKPFLTYLEYLAHCMKDCEVVRRAIDEETKKKERARTDEYDRLMEEWKKKRETVMRP